MKKSIKKHENTLLIYLFCLQIGMFISVIYILLGWFTLFLKWGFKMKILRFFGLVSFDENGNEYIERTDRYALICLALIVLVTFVVCVSGLVANGWVNSNCCIDTVIDVDFKEW